jgi:hypothetical protein
VEKPVEMGLDGTPRHLQFAGNFGVVTTLQQEVGDLLLAPVQNNRLSRNAIDKNAESFSTRWGMGAVWFAQVLRCYPRHKKLPLSLEPVQFYGERNLWNGQKRPFLPDLSGRLTEVPVSAGMFTIDQFYERSMR